MTQTNQIPQLLELSPAIENAPYLLNEVEGGQNISTRPQTCCECCNPPNNPA